MDMWQLTPDTWHMNILLDSQPPSFYSLGVMMSRWFGGKGWPNYKNEILCDKGDCRTAPATPGLLITWQNKAGKKNLIVGQKNQNLLQSPYVWRHTPH